jgi:hypothetical protein
VKLVSVATSKYIRIVVFTIICKLDGVKDYKFNMDLVFMFILCEDGLSIILRWLAIYL